MFRLKRIICFRFLMMLLTSFSSICAQEGSQKGYIITRDNDTIRGFIQNVNVNQFVVCSFKSNTSLKVMNYLPGDILAYRFENNGKFFVSKEVPTISGKKVFFVEYLIKGKANIYFRRDNTDHYYIQKEGDDLTELTEPPVLTKNEAGVMYYKPQKYTGKLKYVLSDCPDLYDEIDGIKLYPTQLIKLAKDYHDKVCDSSKCIVFERKINPVKFNFGLLAGVSYNDFVFNSENYMDMNFGKFFGFKLELENIFFSLERMTISTGIILQNFSTYRFHTDVYRANNVFYDEKTITNIDMKTTSLKMPLSINYTFSQTKFRPYVGLGATNTFYISQNKDLFVSDYNFYFGKAIPFYHLGILGSVGMKYRLNQNHSVFVELNYENSRNVNVNKMLQMENHYFSFQLGYMF